MPLEREGKTMKCKPLFQEEISPIWNADLYSSDRNGQRMITGGDAEAEQNDSAVAIRGRSRSRSPTPEKEEEDELEEKDDLAIGPAPMIPPGGYTNVRDAEEAFIWLLKKTKVDETWSWDKVMRTVIMDPLYKALSTSAEKKNVYQKVS